MENAGTSHFFLQWIVSGLAVLITSKIISGFQISGFFTACLAALAIGLANAILWPILFFLTLPINFLTLGLFTFVINGIVLKVCAALMPGFEIKSWWAAIFGSIVLSLVSMLLHYILI
jgi:putative membrane protein